VWGRVGGAHGRGTGMTKAEQQRLQHVQYSLVLMRSMFGGMWDEARADSCCVKEVPPVRDA
jgi:hypothetical protein